MERILDKAVVAAGCLAVLFVLPASTPFVAMFLAAVTVSALCEWLSERGRTLLITAYLLLASVVPLAVMLLALIAYECMSDRRPFMRAVWIIPLAVAALRLPLGIPMVGTWQPNLAALCLSAIICAVAGVLALRTAALARERNQYRTLRDGVREQALALEARNRSLHAQLKEAASDAAPGKANPAANTFPDTPGEAYPSLVFANLTERELQIAAQVAKGLDNKEIAATVYASEGTVRNHISSILQKTGLRNRTQIAIAYLACVSRQTTDTVDN